MVEESNPLRMIGMYVHVHVHTEYTDVFRKRKCVTKLAGEESRVALRIPPRSRAVASAKKYRVALMPRDSRLLCKQVSLRSFPRL